MSKSLVLILSSITFVPLSALAKVYELNLSQCEIGTSCSKCIEHFKINFSVNDTEKTVKVFGRTPSGEQEESLVTTCSVKSIDNWQCNEFRGTIKVSDGNINYLDNKTMKDINIETCMR
jgi:hypothetical protein